MFSSSKTAIETIGQESLYVLEKTGAAIHGVDDAYLQIALTLLKDYKEKLTNLKKRVDESPLYDSTLFDYEFETMFYAIDRLYAALGNIRSKEQELEATVFHSYICAQDKRVRTWIEEVEQAA